MVSQDSLLVTLVQLVDRLPMPTRPQKRGRGHPQVYTDRLFLKAVVIMIVRHLHTVHELLSVLAQPTAEMQRLCELVSEEASGIRNTARKVSFPTPRLIRRPTGPNRAGMGGFMAGNCTSSPSWQGSGFLLLPC